MHFRSIVTFALLLQLSIPTISATPNRPSGTFHETDPTAPGSLQGRIVDVNGRPAAGLQVRLRGTVRRLTTDEQGYFQFRGLPEGNYVVEATGVGVQPLMQSVQVRSAETAKLTLTVQEDVRQLEEIKIITAKGLRERETLPDVSATAIYAGKKTEVINLAALDANLVTNNTRQVFSKTPGVMVWENDGSGMQVGVSVRGLSPNRSWEFNVRQNGVDISSDPFGYLVACSTTC
jgi:Fe(3+) dicitrate transport protein